MELEFTDITGINVINNEKLIKTATEDTYGSAMATLNNVVEGDGEVRLAIDKIDQEFVFGFRPIENDQASTYQELAYGFVINQSNLSAWDNEELTSLGTLAIGDVLSIEKINATIYYKKNEEVLREIQIKQRGIVKSLDLATSTTVITRLCNGEDVTCTRTVESSLIEGAAVEFDINKTASLEEIISVKPIQEEVPLVPIDKVTECVKSVVNQSQFKIDFSLKSLQTSIAKIQIIKFTAHPRIKGVVQHLDCNDSTVIASIETQIISGTAPYTYSWVGPNNQTFNTQNIAVNVAGLYTLTVTDSRINPRTTSKTFDVGYQVKLCHVQGAIVKQELEKAESSLAREKSAEGTCGRATSLNRLNPDDNGGITYIVDQIDYSKAFGLSTSSDLTNEPATADISSTSETLISEVSYGLLLLPDGTINIRENELSVGDYGKYKIGDVLKVTREGNQIIYIHNNNVLKTTTTDPTLLLVARYLLIDVCATFNNIYTDFCFDAPYFVIDTKDTPGAIYRISGAGLDENVSSGTEAKFYPVIIPGTTRIIEIEFTESTVLGNTVSTVSLELDDALKVVSSSVSILENNETARTYAINNFINTDINGTLNLSLSRLYVDLIYKGCLTDNNYNWVSSKSYNENGVIIEENISYLDDIGRTVQSQFRNFSTSKILATQNIYDSFGRTAISTLSAPLYQGYFCYKPNFVTANAGQLYDFTQFDLPNTSSQLFGEKNNPFGVDQTDKGSLGWYYSNNNNEEPYVAASSFPYTRVEYYNDPLGRPKKTAGLSENYKMGSGHETQVFYGQAGFEFEYVYKSSSKGISKTITVDADGLERVTYTDGLGKVRATCYSGIDNDCMNVPVKYDLEYYNGRSLDIHIAKGQKLKWYINGFSCILSYGGTNVENYVTIKVYDLIGEKELIKGTDYVLNADKTFDFLGAYANKTLYLRISYDYTDDYIGSNGAFYGFGSCPSSSGYYYPSQSFGTTIDYSHWTLNYYDDKGNMIKSIPPEGVDCNGIDPSVGYATESNWNTYNVFVSGNYPMNPSYFSSYDPSPSSIYDPLTQEHSVQLRINTGSYTIPFDETLPCSGTGGTLDPFPGDPSTDRMMPPNNNELNYLSSKALKYLAETTSSSISNVITSDANADNLRLNKKLGELQLDIESRQAEVAANTLQYNEVNNSILEIENLINEIPTDQSNARTYQSTTTTVEELELLKQQLVFEALRLQNDNLGLQEVITEQAALKTIITQQGYYPIEPEFTQKPIFVENGVLVGETGELFDVNPCTSCPPPTPTPCNKFKQATFEFKIEITISDAYGNQVYVLPNGNVTSTPTSFSIFPRLYKNCHCRYYFDYTTLSLPNPIVINDAVLTQYTGEIKYNIKSIWAATSGNNFYPFDPTNNTHKYARYLFFQTIATHNVGPKTDDNISHSMEDTYEYDVLNQLVAETTPDKGLMEHVYDTRGRIRFDQNAQQKIDKKFGYVNYDRAGRPIETGVYNYTSSAALQFQNHNEKPILSSGTSVLTVLDEYDGLDNIYCSEQTYMSYDVADISSSPYYPFSTAPYTTYKQKNLLGRVAKTWNENSITWYSYDMYGRTEWTIEYIIDANVAAYKTMHYQYDASGNLVKTIYQKNDAVEYFEHKNTFDAGQQLTKVETRTNGSNYTEQAKYNYYQHGALKRTEIGNKLQGIDYVYTLDGKLKSMNSPNLGVNDPGNDSYANNGIFTDVFGMTIDYHQNDYTRAGTFINYGLGTNQKYTGTINQVRWNLNAPTLNTNLTAQGQQNVYRYQYNEFNWLTDATFGIYSPACIQNPPVTFSCSSIPPVFIADASNQFKVSGITYDKNGNIETLIRNGNSTIGAMDNFTYNYATTTQSEDGDVVKINNQLNYVTDGVGTSGYATDIENQSIANYTYNAIGELIADASETQTYTYYQNGLAKEVLDNGNLQLRFSYNAQGKRLKKQVYSGGTLVKEVFYIRDLSGAVVCVYETDVVATTTVKDYTLFGLNQLGLYDPATNESRYHLYDHLGNVRATIRENAGALEVLSASDYYPFGGVLPGRNLLSSLNKLNYGYQGKELDQNGFYDFEARQYDARLGRWVTTDPASQFYSPYLAMGNNPISAIDPDGEWIHIVIGALVGGIINTVVHWDKIQGPGDFFAAFGIGAAAGALGAATFGASLLPTATVAGAFAAGALAGVVSTAVSAPVMSVGNSLYFGDPMMTGDEYLRALAWGGALGGVFNAGSAVLQGKPWFPSSDKPGGLELAPGPTKTVTDPRGNEPLKLSTEKTQLTEIKEAANDLAPLKINKEGIRMSSEISSQTTKSINGITEHATHQAITRGFKPSDILRIVNEGTPVQAMGRYGPQIRYTLGGNTVVINSQGNIVTLYSSSQGSVNGLGKGFFIPFK
ncbi:MAG: RHS repeat-associated core domain-containing protein [Flavobacteriales bacterium]